MVITVVNGLSTGFVLGFELQSDISSFVLHLGLISIYFQKN